MGKKHDSGLQEDGPRTEPLTDPVDLQPVAPPSRFKVLAEKCISWMGCMTWLHKDDVIDAAGYGTDGIARLIEQGVRLQPVE